MNFLQQSHQKIGKEIHMPLRFILGVRLRDRNNKLEILIHAKSTCIELMLIKVHQGTTLMEWKRHSSGTTSNSQTPVVCSHARCQEASKPAIKIKNQN